MPETLSPSTPQSAERLLAQLEWRVLRRLDGLLQGDYRTLLRGTGMDLSDLREYQPQDDVRHIDWNVTARLGTPHVRVFSEDREMTAWLLLDLSASLDFGPPGRSKRDQLQQFSAVLARLLTRRGNRVGALLHGGAASKDVVLPARSSRAHVLHLLQMLRQSHTEQPAAGATQLQRMLQSAKHLLRKRCTVFLVSDFLSDTGWEKPLALLAQRHDVVAVRLFDPLERSLPDIGMVWMRDAETGERLHVDTRSAGFRQRYARLAAERETNLRTSLQRAGVDTLELSTSDDLLDAMLRFMMLRGLKPRVHVSASPMRAS